MKTATLEELNSNPACVERWVAEGERVEVTRAGKVIADFIPRAQIEGMPWEAEAHRARTKAIWGDRVFTDAQVKEMRDYEDGERE